MNKKILKQVKTVIFDLDGTLADTLEDLTDATNAALAAFGYPIRSMDQVQYSVGSGVKELIKNTLPESERSDQNIAKVLHRYIEIYGKNYLVKTKAYDGLFDVVDALYKNGVKLGVVTNKSHSWAKEITRALYDDRFEIIAGVGDRFPPKPDPALTVSVMEALGGGRDTTVFIGDSDVDYLTAKNAGLACINVLWGFRKKEELALCGAHLFAHTPSELLEMLL